MIEDDFYATIKLISGEEIFAKVSPVEEDGRTLLLVSSPITVSEIKLRGHTAGYKLEPWLKTTEEDMFVLEMKNVLTISESDDIEMIMMYQSYLRQASKAKSNLSKLDREMGYISNVNDAKEILEKLYKNS